MYGLVQSTPECCCDSHGLKFWSAFSVFGMMTCVRQANVIKRWGNVYNVDKDYLFPVGFLGGNSHVSRVSAPTNGNLCTLNSHSNVTSRSSGKNSHQ